ncbi:MAG: ATP-binding protein, partial [Burkholderiaceae bacterium]
TLKGSARMAGHAELGHEFHQAETQVSTMQQQAPHRILQVIIALRQQVDHWTYQIVHAGDAYLNSLSASELAASNDTADYLATNFYSAESRSTAFADHSDLKSIDGSVVTPNQPDVNNVLTQQLDGDVSELTPMSVAASPPSRTTQRSHMLRVRADRLAQFADTGAEIWSGNARLREGLQLQRRALLDLADDLSRLRAQLRELEIEAESRVLARAHQGASTEFDPLEFDRYTRLHELTRMMTESMTDVVGVQRGMLAQLEQLTTAAAEQQRDVRRHQAELQHLRSQPLHTVEPRLRHVLRQAAREVGCDVALVLQDGTVEIERDLLDRLLGPLEHLLRNAVVHGIEHPEQRIAMGNPAEGCVTLQATLTGNELQLIVQDDGRGLNLDRIQERAVAAGLISAGDVMQARELGELIFTPGFSTATELTTLSGRGIGLDAVRAELHSLGGQISLDSEAGRGCRFTLRLPVGLASLQV